MSEPIVLCLPWPPSANTYYRSVLMGKHPRVIISRKGREYSEDVQGYIGHQFNRPPLEGRLAVQIMAHAPTRRAFDVDNRLKPLLDALQKARVFLDDGQIDDLRIMRGEIKQGGEAIVQIQELPDEG